MKTPTILSLVALIMALISLLMQFGLVGGVSLKFGTPEEAIKTIAGLNRDADYRDVREAKKIMQEESTWEFADPDGIEVVKTLEVRGTGDASANGGALCFLRFTKGDGVTSHKVVLLTKNSRGMFSPEPISSWVRDEYGSIMAAWEKDGTLK